MAYKCLPFSRTLHGSADSGGALTLFDVAPDPGYIFHYSRCSVEDDTTANANFRVGVDNAGNFTPTGEVKALAKSTLSTFALSDVQADGDNSEKFGVKVTAAAAADDIRLYVNGYVEKKEAA